MPSFEEYMEVGEVEVTVCAVFAGMLMCMENVATKEAYEWLKSRPKLIKSLLIKGRIMNDLTGFEGDMKRGYVTNAINCYMKQYKVTEHQAFSELSKMITKADKIVNEEYLTAVGVERCVLKAAIDLSRMITISYNVDDGFTHPEGKIKEYMTSLFVDLIHL